MGYYVEQYRYYGEDNKNNQGIVNDWDGTIKFEKPVYAISVQTLPGIHFYIDYDKEENVGEDEEIIDDKTIIMNNTGIFNINFDETSPIYKFEIENSNRHRQLEIDNNDSSEDSENETEQGDSDESSELEEGDNPEDSENETEQSDSDNDSESEEIEEGGNNDINSIYKYSLDLIKESPIGHVIVDIIYKE